MNLIGLLTKNNSKYPDLKVILFKTMLKSFKMLKLCYWLLLSSSLCLKGSGQGTGIAMDEP